MNWTGGRLRRHSHNRPGSLSRVQKRHFAKARLWCPNSFHQFSQFQYPSYHSTARTTFGQPAGVLKPPLVSPYDDDDGIEERIGANQPCRHYSDVEDLSQRLLSVTPGDPQRKRKRQLSGSRDACCQTPQCPLGASELDFVKCQLLQKSDWTAVALSRPLTMTFTPIEDREKVGRRRRITKDDKKRQSAPKVFSTEHSPQFKKIQPEHKDSRLYPTRDIKIKIGGEYYGGDPASQSQKRAQSQESPESMLLDYEGSLIRTSMKVETDTGQKHNRHKSDEHSTGMANYGCVESVSPGLRQLPDFSLQDTLSSRYFPTESSLGSPRFPEFGGLTSGSPVPALRVYRRFTLDEQAEHERKLDLGEHSRDACKRESEDSYIGPSSSPRFIKGVDNPSSSFLQKSPPANQISPQNLLSPSSNQNYSRLPPNQTFISRSLRPIGDLETIQPFIVHSGAVSSPGQGLSGVRVRRDHSRINEFAEQSRPPIFFGQSVEPFSEAETNQSSSKTCQHLIQQCNNQHQHINEPTCTNGRNRVWAGFPIAKSQKFTSKTGGDSSSVTTESDAIQTPADASRNLLHPTDYASHSDTDFFSQTSPSEDHSLIQSFSRNSSPPYYQSPKFTVRPARFPLGQPNISRYSIPRIY